MTEPWKFLSPRHMTYVQHRVQGKSARESALLAGYTPASARNAYAIDQIPAVAQALKKHQQELSLQTKYDLTAAMRELDDVITFAKSEEGRNASAYAKAVELKMKLCGLLIERVDQRNIGSFSVNIGGIEPPPSVAADAVPYLEHEDEPAEKKKEGLADNDGDDKDLPMTEDALEDLLLASATA